VTGPVVLVTRDSRDRPGITWYEDEIGFYDGDPVAWVTGGGALHISPHASVEAGEAAKEAHSVVRDSVSPDLSRFATHVEPEPGAPLEPIPGRSAA
jgi:hypothetical protein